MIDELIIEHFTPAGMVTSGGIPRLSTKTLRGSVILSRLRVECASNDPLSDLELAFISLHAIEARHAATAVAWQPIETAPRDGTRILIYSPRIGIESGEWHQRMHPRGWAAGSTDRPRAPTHWMPLLEPPKNE